jgi:hypothetical protein
MEATFPVHRCPTSRAVGAFVATAGACQPALACRTAGAGGSVDAGIGAEVEPRAERGGVRSGVRTPAARPATAAQMMTCTGTHRF